MRGPDSRFLKDFKAAFISMFKELKDTVLKKM